MYACVTKMEDSKLLNSIVKIVFADGKKEDKAHLGKVVWIGNKYIELQSDRDNELIPHHNVIRIEIIKKGAEK